jgi:hypothetical protein
MKVVLRSEKRPERTRAAVSFAKRCHSPDHRRRRHQHAQGGYEHRGCDQGERDIAVGSNTFNILGCLGLSGLMSGDLGLMMAPSLLAFDIRERSRLLVPGD